VRYVTLDEVDEIPRHLQLAPVVREARLSAACLLATGGVFTLIAVATEDRPVVTLALIAAFVPPWMFGCTRARRAPKDLDTLAPPPDGAAEHRRRTLVRAAILSAVMAAIAVAGFTVGGSLAIFTPMIIGLGLSIAQRARGLGRWEAEHQQRVVYPAHWTPWGARDWYAAPAAPGHV
jgi:hypothetical protein